MKLKKQPDGFYYLHNAEDQPLICPHQDNGTEIIIEPNRLQPNQPPKQTIKKQHLVCGSWCALFHLCSVSPDGKEGTVEQGCSSNRAEFHVNIQE